MNEQANNILFWISFVGFAIFMVNSIHASVVLRLTKQKEFPKSEFFMTTISAIMAIMFIAMSVSTQVGHTHPELKTTTPTFIEYHKEIGSVVLYDSITNKNDTLILFQKIK